MESHRTPDGRPATPTVVLLNDEFEEAGCFVERPAVLQSWYLENQGTLGERELYRQKYAWYDRDAGSETLREFVELLERAASGAGGCRH